MCCPGFRAESGRHLFYFLDGRGNGPVQHSAHHRLSLFRIVHRLCTGAGVAPILHCAPLPVCVWRLYLGLDCHRSRIQCEQVHGCHPHSRLFVRLRAVRRATGPEHGANWCMVVIRILRGSSVRGRRCVSVGPVSTGLFPTPACPGFLVYPDTSRRRVEGPCLRCCWQCYTLLFGASPAGVAASSAAAQPSAPTSRVPYSLMEYADAYHLWVNPGRGVPHARCFRLTPSLAQLGRRQCGPRQLLVHGCHLRPRRTSALGFDRGGRENLVSTCCCGVLCLSLFAFPTARSVCAWFSSASAPHFALGFAWG